MTTYKVYLEPGTTTRTVLREIREAINPLVHDLVRNNNHYNLPSDTATSMERRRARSKVRYVFGVGHSLRDTHLVSFCTDEDFLEVTFPNDYKSFEQADFWTKMRVACHDAIMKIDCIDRTREKVNLFPR